jgi:hypothetical protein
VLIHPELSLIIIWTSTTHKHKEEAMPTIGQELLEVPFGKMIAEMGRAIANAQRELDQNAIQLLIQMANEEISLQEGKKVPLLALGLTPMFYAFQESTIEVKISITVRTHEEEDKKAKSGFGLWSSSVNAQYARSYDYSAEGASLLRTKLVAIPPPITYQKVIEELANKQADELDPTKIADDINKEINAKQ